MTTHPEWKSNNEQQSRDRLHPSVTSSMKSFLLCSPRSSRIVRLIFICWKSLWIVTSGYETFWISSGFRSRYDLYEACISLKYIFSPFTSKLMKTTLVKIICSLNHSAHVYLFSNISQNKRSVCVTAMTKVPPSTDISFVHFARVFHFGRVRINRLDIYIRTGQRFIKLPSWSLHFINVL